MKITLSSPDGLGDFVLRSAMVRHLLDAGHAVQIFMRRPAADLARDLFPEADIQLIAQDPYDRLVRASRNPFAPELEAIKRFRPDLYVAGAFQLNFFDEVWIEQKPAGVRSAGFRCTDEFWPAETTADPAELSRAFEISVPVATDLPEPRKNQMLAEAILESTFSQFALPSPSPHSLAAARRILSEHQINEGGYVVACLGGRRGLELKDWGEENWKAFFTRIDPSGSPAIVFLGNPAENPSIESIRAHIPPGVRHSNLSAQPPDVAVSFGLVALSAGYVGRDSGVMHLAAAARRPILAVFGGAHWGRFLPASQPFFAATQAVACRGCNFECPHPEPYCIRGVPVAVMLEGWRALAGGRLETRIFEVCAPAGLTEKIARASSRHYAELAQQTRRWDRHNLRPAGALDSLGMRLRSIARGR